MPRTEAFGFLLVWRGIFLNPFITQIAAFIVYFLYASFFEWSLHRWVFHTPKYNYSMFHKHTIVHHQIYKAGETYQTDVDEPESVPMNWWALPMMLGFHLPFFLAIQWLTGIPSVWGGLAAITTYFTIYESIHWAMHVPRAAKFLSHFRAYRFLDAHHHTHHKYMLSNLNVVLPLADWCMGTLRLEGGKRTGLVQSVGRMAPSVRAAVLFVPLFIGKLFR